MWPLARDEAIAFGMYRLLRHRFANAPQATNLFQGYDEHMATLGYDVTFTSTDYSSGDGRALGNHLAAQIIAFGQQDGSNEQNDYANTVYEPLNPSLIVDLPGNPSVVDMNRWQPLTLDLFIDQSGNPIPGETPPFLSPEWGQVTSWALSDADLTSYTRDGFEYKVYHDPRQPAMFAEDGSGSSDIYVDGHAMVALWSGFLDPTDGVMWDISPAASGNRDAYPNTLETYASLYDATNGGSPSPGHRRQPLHGRKPYAPNMVPRGDYARVLAEFWADGPDSETPPGHWFTILNYVSDHPELVKQFQGEGPVLDDLEWDVKSYLALGSAMHDCAISAWGAKGWYDTSRPVTAIRGMAELGKAPTQAHRTTTQVVCLWCLAGLKRLKLATRSPGLKGPTLGRSKFGLGKEARPSTTWTPNLPAWVGSWPNLGSPTSVPLLSARRSQDTSADTAPFQGLRPRCSPPSPAMLTSQEGWGPSLHLPTNFWCLKTAQVWMSNCSGPPTVMLQTNAACPASTAAFTPTFDDVPGRLMGIDIGLDAFDRAAAFFGGDATNDRVATDPGVDTCPADINDDGFIAIADILLIFLGEFGCESGVHSRHQRRRQRHRARLVGRAPVRLRRVVPLTSAESHVEGLDEGLRCGDPSPTSVWAADTNPTS